MVGFFFLFNGGFLWNWTHTKNNVQLVVSLDQPNKWVPLTRNPPQGPIVRNMDPQNVTFHVKVDLRVTPCNSQKPVLFNLPLSLNQRGQPSNPPPKKKKREPGHSINKRPPRNTRTDLPVHRCPALAPGARTGGAERGLAQGAAHQLRDLRGLVDAASELSWGFWGGK